MSSTFNLVSTAVGDPDLAVSTARTADYAPHFDLYDIQLPLSTFNGIPNLWTFAVLNQARMRAGAAPAATILAEVHRIITKLEPSKLLVVISDDPKVHLADEFGNIARDVFCLDSHELPTKKDYRTQPRLAPFVLSVRRRLDIKPVLARSFSPYQRNKPASGWRFFGREKQLGEIIRSSENLVIVGARRVGKTSLMLEAERRLKEQGATVYYVDVQDCRSANEVVAEIARVLSPRDAARAFRHHEVLHEKVLANILKQLSTSAAGAVLLLDELGNVMSQLPKEDWSFLWLLRKFGARTGLKIVFSCFQEVFFKQQAEFEGPLINFATTLRLGAFSKKEVEEFLIAPLDFWKTFDNKQELLNLVIANVGSHPYFLQFFCHALFDRFTEKGKIDLLQQANLLLQKDIHDWFASAVDEIFFRIPSPAIRYLFLQRCYDADTLNQQLSQAEFSDDWLESALLDLRYKSTIRGRRNLLEGLEMHGLCSAIDYDRAKKVIAAPIIYGFVRRTVGSFESWLKKLGQEIERESSVWELERC